MSCDGHSDIHPLIFFYNELELINFNNLLDKIELSADSPFKTGRIEITEDKNDWTGYRWIIQESPIGSSPNDWAEFTASTIKLFDKLLETSKHIRNQRRR